MTTLEKKTNREIIIEEIENFADRVSDLYEQELSDEDYSTKFDELVNKSAINLLSKLNRLDRGKVGKLIKYISNTPRKEEMIKAGWDLKDLDNYLDAKQKVVDEVIDQICQLISEEGEVIAEGEILDIYNCDVRLHVLFKTKSKCRIKKDMGKKYNDKKIQIIIREVE